MNLKAVLGKALLGKMLAVATFFTAMAVPMTGYSVTIVSNIQVVEVMAGGYNRYVRVKTSQHSNHYGCTNDDYIAIDSNYAFYKEQYAAVLVAATTGQTIGVWFTRCTPDGKYPVVGRVSLEDAV